MYYSSVLKYSVEIFDDSKGGFMSEDAAGFSHLQTNMPNHYHGNDKMKIVKFFTYTDFVNLQDLPIDFRDTCNNHISQCILYVKKGCNNYIF